MWEGVTDVHTDEFRVLASSSAASGMLTLSGELDVAGVPRLEREVGLLGSSRARMLVLELAELRFASVAGVRAMIGALDDGPWVYGRIVNPMPPVCRAFELTGHGV